MNIKYSCVYVHLKQSDMDGMINFPVNPGEYLNSSICWPKHGHMLAFFQLTKRKI